MMKPATTPEDTIPESLVAELVAGRLVPFVGSGVSRAAYDFPAWDGLLERMAQRLEQEAQPDEANAVRYQLKKKRFLKAAEEAWQELHPAGFHQVLRDTFDVREPQTPPLDLALPRALWSLCPSIIVTTNYDRVLIWANPAANTILNDQRAELGELYRTATAAAPRVWHLHGHIERAGSLILAPIQYEAFYGNAPQARQDYEAALLQLRSLVANYSLLFVGFSFSDRHVMDLLDGVLDAFGGNLRPSYALVKVGEQNDQQLWDRYNIRSIAFDDFGPPLVQRLEQIARAADAARAGTSGGTVSQSARPVPIVPPGYTQWLQKECGDLDLLGLRVKQGQAVTLTNVYVPLTTATPEGSELDEQGGSRSRRALRRGREASEEQPKPRLLLDLLDRDSLCISGPPGSGKSTFCRWSAVLACGDALPPHAVAAATELAERYPASFRRRLPVLIRLRDFWTALPDRPDCQELSGAEFEAALERWLAERQPGGLTWRLLQDHLEHGSALLLLDGVDEVPLVHGASVPPCRPRAMLLHGLAAVAAAWRSAGNRVLVTSRPYGLTSGDPQRLGLPHAEVAELSKDLQRLLIRRWFRCLVDDGGAAETLAGEMFDHLQERPEIAELAANPLLLTAICIIYQEGKRLPQDKYDLYDRITDTVLCNRYPNDPTQVDLVRNRLCVVAYGMHTGYGLGEPRPTPQAEATHDEIDRMIKRYRDDSPGTEREVQAAIQVRDELLSRSGILLPRDGDRAAFYHLTFQDFLAAQRLLDLEGERLLAAICQRAEHSEWRSTLSFTFSSLLAKNASPDRAIRLLAAMIECLGTGKGSGVVFGETPNERESGLPENDSRPLAADRLAIVAADCLEILWGRGAGLRPEDDRRLRDYCLSAIGRETPLKERFELGLALGRLGDPRIVTDLRDPAAYVQIPTGTYRIGDDRKEDYGPWTPLDEQNLDVAQPFWLSRFPVTNAQYGMFLNDNGYDTRRWWSDEGWQWKESKHIREPGRWRDVRWNGVTQPVVAVSFWEAEAFCRWAGARLPSEREWEAAARGPDSLRYPWGNDWEDGICNSTEGKLQRTSPVGIFPRSRSKPFGLDDMAGNVWEWTSDFFEQGKPYRVLRGGAWAVTAWGCRAAVRINYPPGYRFYDVGFRVCLCRQNSPE
jgi:formylglycine-generating enzyme required for sulfatase activity